MKTVSTSQCRARSGCWVGVSSYGSDNRQRCRPGHLGGDALFSQGPGRPAGDENDRGS